MEARSQWYIGTVNGAVLCVDRYGEGSFEGRLVHGYSGEEIPFATAEEAIFTLERLFDSLRFPFPTTRERSFTEEKPLERQEGKRERLMKDEALLNRHGDLGTFIVRVQHRQNSSWQGRLTWMEENKTVYFRSIWEMVKLMESALDTVSAPEDEPSWFGNDEAAASGGGPAGL